jgi:hypothetical protein
MYQRRQSEALEKGGCGRGRLLSGEVPAVGMATIYTSRRAAALYNRSTRGEDL